MRPVLLFAHCGEICLVGKSLRDAETMTQMLGTPAPPKLGTQHTGETSNHLLAIGRPLALKHVVTDPNSDLPIQQRRLGVNGDGSPRAGRVDAHLATRFLLSYDGSTATFNAYRRKIERLCQWSWLITVSSVRILPREEIEQFIRFTLNPPKA